MTVKKKKTSFFTILLAVLLGIGAVGGIMALTSSNNDKDDKADNESPVEYTLKFGNDYNSTWADKENRACIQPYVITIPANTSFTAIDGYLFGLYSITNEADILTNTLITSNWVESFTVTSSGTYGVAIKKVDDTNFDFSTDRIYISDYVTSSVDDIWVLSDEKTE